MFQLQPSELMKLALVVFAADLLTRRPDASADPKMVIVPVLAVLGISGVLILKQPDMGTALVLGCIAFGYLMRAGVIPEDVCVACADISLRHPELSRSRPA